MRRRRLVRASDTWRCDSRAHARNAPAMIASNPLTVVVSSPGSAASCRSRSDVTEGSLSSSSATDWGTRVGQRFRRTELFVVEAWSPPVAGSLGRVCGKVAARSSGDHASHLRTDESGRGSDASRCRTDVGRGRLATPPRTDVTALTAGTVTLLAPTGSDRGSGRQLPRNRRGSVQLTPRTDGQRPGDASPPRTDVDQRLVDVTATHRSDEAWDVSRRHASDQTRPGDFTLPRTDVGPGASLPRNRDGEPHAATHRRSDEARVTLGRVEEATPPRTDVGSGRG